MATNVCIALLLGASLSAGAVVRGGALPVITFEDITSMGNSPGSPVPPVSQLSDHYLAQYGVRFSSGAAFVAVVDHGAGVTPSGMNIIGGTTPAGALTYDQSNPIVAAFFDSTGAQPRAVSFVSVYGDLITIPNTTKTMDAFDVHGNLIATITLQDPDPSPLAISMPGIHSVRLYSSSATVGFDNLSFDAPTPVCTLPDINGDGTVNTPDLAKVLEAFGKSTPPGSVDATADLNGDGMVNTVDLSILLRSFGQRCP